jgi:hypothetical protein
MEESHHPLDIAAGSTKHYSATKKRGELSQNDPNLGKYVGDFSPQL